MGAYGELFPGRKLKHEGGQSSPGREHDPGGPLDLDRGVVFLAPPAEKDSGRSAESPDGAGSAGNEQDTDVAEPGTGATSSD